VDPHLRRWLVVAVVAEAVEARRRSARNKRAGLEPTDRRALPPNGLPQLGDGPVRGDNDADQKQRAERDRGPDLAAVLATTPPTNPPAMSSRM
jgi:hypothetical protein